MQSPEAPKKAVSPDFLLSVLVMVDGQRKAELQELTLCLAAQENTSFEVLFLVSGASGEDLQIANDLCTHLHEIAGVTARCIESKALARSAVLNAAIGVLKGSHFVVLDIADVLFDNWVSNFEQLARENATSVLSAYSLYQEWEAYHNRNNDRALKAIDSISNCYCHDFSFIEQLRYNDCPTSSLAFPLVPVQGSAIRFDERFKQLYSWDFLLQAVMRFGIATSKQASSIHRVIKAEAHQQVAVSELISTNNKEGAILRENFHNTCQNFDQSYSRFALTSWLDASNGPTDDTLFSPEFLLAHCHLEIQFDENERKANVLIPSLSQRPGYDLVFAPDAAERLKTARLVFDDLAGFTMHDFKLKLIDHQEQSVELGINDCEQPGLQVDSMNIVVLGESPTIVISPPKGFCLQTLHVRISARRRIRDEHYRQVLRSKRSAFVGRVWRFMMRRLKNG